MRNCGAACGGFEIVSSEQREVRSCGIRFADDLINGPLSAMENWMRALPTVDYKKCD